MQRASWILCLGLVLVTHAALAQVPLQVPFSGRLERDGEVFSDTGEGVTLELTLWDAEAGGTLLYKQVIPGVKVYGGQFTALLGPEGLDAGDQPAHIEDAVVGPGGRWVGVRLLGAGASSTDVALATRKQLLSVPAALYVREALDFRVRGDAVIEGTAAVGGTTSVGGSVKVGSGAAAGFDNSPGYLYVAEGAQFSCAGCGDQNNLFGSAEWGNLTVQGRVLSTDDNLHLSPPGGKKVLIQDDWRAAGGVTNPAGAGLEVEGELVVKGNVRFDSPSLDCVWTGCVDTGGNTFICDVLKPGYPILGGIDIATYDSQKPAGCTYDNAEDDIRLYCCRFN